MTHRHRRRAHLENLWGFLKNFWGFRWYASQTRKPPTLLDLFSCKQTGLPLEGCSGAALAEWGILAGSGDEALDMRLASDSLMQYAYLRALLEDRDLDTLIPLEHPVRPFLVRWTEELRGQLPPKVLQCVDDYADNKGQGPSVPLPLPPFPSAVP